MSRLGDIEVLFLSLTVVEALAVLLGQAPLASEQQPDLEDQLQEAGVGNIAESTRSR